MAPEGGARAPGASLLPPPMVLGSKDCNVMEALFIYYENEKR